MACDLLAMATQAVSESPSQDWEILQVDISNAFNTVNRDSLLMGALRKVPGACNWLTWCYASPCPLFCQGQLLTQRSTEVHQGNAMGLLAFAIGLDSILD